jgi:hypothetical protein
MLYLPSFAHPIWYPSKLNKIVIPPFWALFMVVRSPLYPGVPPTYRLSNNSKYRARWSLVSTVGLAKVVKKKNK